jgi:hypothetical protein
MNGAHARVLPLPSSPATIPAKAAARGDIAIEILNRIGNAVADAVLWVGTGIEDWEHGETLRPQRGRKQMFVRLYELQESTLGGIDFPAVARVEGKRVRPMTQGLRVVTLGCPIGENVARVDRLRR